MSSSAVLVHSICTILSNYGETLAFGEMATGGLLERQFQIHPLCHHVLKSPHTSFDMSSAANITVLAHDIAEAAGSHWAICTMPLPHHSIEVAIVGHSELWLYYHIVHPPHLPVHWPAWTACYEIIERFSILLSSGNPTKNESYLL